MTSLANEEFKEMKTYEKYNKCLQQMLVMDTCL